MEPFPDHPAACLPGCISLEAVYGFLCPSFVVPLAFAILIYLRHNAEALAIMNLSIVNVLPIDARFFQAFVMAQGWIGLFWRS
jgi:hypothetical protein